MLYFSYIHIFINKIHVYYIYIAKAFANITTYVYTNTAYFIQSKTQNLSTTSHITSTIRVFTYFLARPYEAGGI